MKVLVDTDVIIDALRGVKKAINTLAKLREENELLISGITEMELMAGRDASDKRKRELILSFLSKFKKVNPTNETLQLAGEFRRKYDISPPDCIIAATAVLEGAKLLTRNLRDFKRIKEVELLG